MRLSYKIFVTTALLILALAGVGTWSLLAISRLVDVNRAIATQSVPALRMATDLGLLPTFLGTEEERSQHQEVVAAFTTYRRLVTQGPGLSGERRFAAE